MKALSQPFDPSRGLAARWPPFPARAVAPFLLLSIGALAAAVGGVVPEIALSLAGAGFHGSLLAVALASAWGGAAGWRPLAWVLQLLLCLAMLSARLLPWGATAHVLPVLALSAFGARHAQLRRIGWCRPEARIAWFLGAGVGLFLGGHLLLSASRTLGYPLRPTPVASLLDALAYDLGANGPSAELFFRGVIFNFWHRRRGFWPAATLSTGASLVRYVLDPALPGAPEVVIGALFYMTLLNLSGCGLLALSGSIFPSLLASLLFFGAYRAL